MSDLNDLSSRGTDVIEQEYMQILRDLAVQILRVARGAGKPNFIPQIARYVAIYDSELKSRDDCMIEDHHYHNWLDFRAPLQNSDSDVPHERQHLDDAIEQIVSGSLQFAASRIAGQDLQVRHGKSEIEDGIRSRKAALDKIRQ